MTTREELIEGCRMMIRERTRTTSAFGPDDWTYVVHDEEGGWTTEDIYRHLVGTAETVPGLVGALSQAQEGQNAAANLDIDAFNAQGIAARESLSGSELMAAFKTAHEKVIEFLQGMPEEQLGQQRRFGAVEAPTAELLDTFFLLHGLSHIYLAQSRPLS